MTENPSLTATGIVGAGPVAQALGRLLHMRGMPIAAVSSRTPDSAARAAHYIGYGVDVVTLEEMARRVQRVLIATADAGITPAAQALAREGFRGLALHTCGARGPEALAALRHEGVSCGVLHPLQTIVTRGEGVSRIPGVTIAISGDGPAIQWAQDIVRRLDGRALAIAADELPLYHAGAVMAGNALVAAVDAAVELMQAAGVERTAALQAIRPLCERSLANSLRLGPEAALTGPVARGDTATVVSHLAALKHAPRHVAQLYRSVGVCLIEIARRRGLAEESVRALAAVFEAGSTGETDGSETGSHL